MKKKLRQFFCQHDYELICWKQVHCPNHEPYRIVILQRCAIYDKNNIWYLRNPTLQETWRKAFPAYEDMSLNGEENWTRGKN